MEYFGGALQDSVIIGKHEIITAGKISEGGYSVVYKATDVKTQEMMAVK